MFKSVLDYVYSQKVFCVVENGWYYSETKGVFETKEEAYNFWKELYYELVGVYPDNDNFSTTAKIFQHPEGFWSYDIEEVSIKEFLEEREKNIKEQTIKNESEKISERVDIIIKNEAYRKEKEEFNNIMQGMFYYLIKNNIYSSVDFNEMKENFFNHCPAN